MIIDFFVSVLEDVNVDDLWFKQNGATCHTTNHTISFRKKLWKLASWTYGVVSKIVRLNTAELFLWRYVKSLVYADKPKTIDALEDNNRRAIADIQLQLLQKVVDNFTSRLGFIRATSGGHFPKIVFQNITANTYNKAKFWP